MVVAGFWRDRLYATESKKLVFVMSGTWPIDTLNSQMCVAANRLSGVHVFPMNRGNAFHFYSFLLNSIMYIIQDVTSKAYCTLDF